MGCCCFLIKIVRGHTKIVHEWNGHLEIFSLPQVIEIASPDILQKTVVGCPCLSSMIFIEARPVWWPANAIAILHFFGEILTLSILFSFIFFFLICFLLIIFIFFLFPFF